MKRLSQAIEVYRERGFFTMCSRTLSFLTSVNIYSTFWQVFYKLKAVLLDNYIVSVNGVAVDLDNEVYSESMVSALRSKNYENGETKLIQSHIRTEIPVVDLGAGIGYTACILDRYTDENVAVIGVEANEQLLPVVEKTRELNNADFDIINAAYHPNREEAEIHVAKDFWSSSKYVRAGQPQVRQEIQSCSLREIRKSADLEESFQLVVDIEGGEHDLITDEMDVLQEFCELIILELHSFTERNIEYYIKELEASGFQLLESYEDIYCFENRKSV